MSIWPYSGYETLFTISWMDVVGHPHKQLVAEAYYNVMIDITNDMTSDLKQTATCPMVGRKKLRQTNKKVQKYIKMIVVYKIFSTTYSLESW